MMETKTIIAATILGLGIAAGGFFPGYYYYQSHMANRTVTVKGLAEMDVVADLAVWEIKFRTTGNDLPTLQRQMAQHLTDIQNYLTDKGFPADAVSVGRMNTNDLMANAYRDQTADKSRYILSQTVTVRSAAVDAVAGASNDIGSLVGKGIIFDNQEYESPVSYLFTGLNAVKPQMLEEATRNARQAADEFAKASDSRVGKIKRASQGVFSILPRVQTQNTTETRQIDKKVRVVSTIEYYLD